MPSDTRFPTGTNNGRLGNERILPNGEKPIFVNGRWEIERRAKERQGGKVYATALAMLSLAVKNHFLPIYQR